MVELLLVFQLLQSSNGRLYCDGRGGAVGPGTVGYRFLAGTTRPDPHSLFLHLGFAAEGARVLGVLASFSLPPFS